MTPTHIAQAILVAATVGLIIWVGLTSNRGDFR